LEDFTHYFFIYSFLPYSISSCSRTPTHMLVNAASDTLRLFTFI
jgi:hypothetical protein